MSLFEPSIITYLLHKYNVSLQVTQGNFRKNSFACTPALLQTFTKKTSLFHSNQTPSTTNTFRHIRRTRARITCSCHLCNLSSTYWPIFSGEITSTVCDAAVGSDTLLASMTSSFLLASVICGMLSVSDGFTSRSPCAFVS